MIINNTKDLISVLESLPKEIDILEFINIQTELKDSKKANTRHIIGGIIIGFTVAVIVLDVFFKIQ